MVRSTFLGVQPTQSEVRKNSFGSPHVLSKGVTNQPLVTPDSPSRPEKDTAASTSTAATSSTDAHNERGQQPQHTDSEVTDVATDDQLSILRDGPEVTITKLRKMLDESSQRDATAKAALAKSDAVILELRSSVRQLKRELERVQNENVSLQEQPSHEAALLERAEEKHESEISSLRSQLEEKNSGDQSREEYIGELQVQLDRAHAQILTADMVRKELEDTLEAEQYTWELRVQDQDRTIAALQQECQTMQQDMTQCRSQWSEAEEGWNKQLQDLQEELESTKRELNNAHSPSNDLEQLRKTVTTLEQDRTELQTCLDEAMKELEAVDAEIQAAQIWQTERDELMEENRRLQALLDSGEVENVSSVKPLKDLVGWLQERPTGVETDRQQPEKEDDPESMIAYIRQHVDALHGKLESAEVGSDLGDSRDKVAALESQLSVYRGDLKAREESSAELRTSLKEAVALLKPLQEVVDKTEQEKEELNEELERLRKLIEEGGENQDLRKELQHTKEQLATKEEEIKKLKADEVSLKKNLEETQKQTASRGVSKGIASIASRSIQPPSGEGTEEQRDVETSAKLEKAREEIRAKRASERALKKMLLNAQNTFSKLNQENKEVSDQNYLLHEKLSKTEKRLTERSMDANGSEVSQSSQDTIGRLESTIKDYSDQLEQKNKEIAQMSQELQRVLEDAEVRETEERWEQAHRVGELEAELVQTKGDLKSRKDAERVLSTSLKEALGLLRPLQNHLETAEREKKMLNKELKACRGRLARLENGEDPSRTDTSSNLSRSFQLPPDVQRANDELEDLVERLEDENARLQDAINLSMSADDVTQPSGSRSVSKENFVELKSRYEVTRQKLEHSNSQREKLSQQVTEKEEEERRLVSEMKTLREQLQQSNEELENAKYIATSALVKVEEMTMAAVEKEMVDLSAEGGQHGMEIVEKEIMDMSRNKHMVQESEEVRKLRLQVEALEREVSLTRHANAGREESVQKDQSTRRITDQRHHRTRATNQKSSKDWYAISEDDWAPYTGRRQLT